MGIRKLLSVGLAATAILWAAGAGAYDLPSVNLGFTSFLDGGPPAGPGVYLTQYVQYFSSDRFTDQDGDRLLPREANEDLDVWVSLTQLIYQSDRAVLFGGKWGLDVIVPVVDLNVDYDIDGPFPEDNGTGFGDLLVGPFLQWDPVMGAKGPVFMHRVEFQLIFPTGKYDDDRELNPGSNFFSFNPYWAGTLFLTRAGPSPPACITSGTPRTTIPTGDSAMPTTPRRARPCTPTFPPPSKSGPSTCGWAINGYYLKQVTDTQVDGDDLDDSREQVFGIGPGLLWHITPDAHLFFNSYFETSAENRPEGERFNLRLVYHF